MTDAKLKVGFIGGGRMAEAIIRGLVGKQVIQADESWVSDVSNERLALMRSLGLNTTQDNNKIVENSEIIILAVKPDQVEDVLGAIRSNLKKDTHTIISIAAGKTIQSMEAALQPQTIPVVRVMPNTPCLVNESATGYAIGSHCTDTHAKLAGKIFNSVGLAKPVPEKLLDAVTGLSGSGPAYVYMFIEALSDAGVLNGLPRDTARELAAQLVYGAAKMVLENKSVHLGELRNQVESPGGTTITGSYALEQGNFRGTVIGAVTAATKKSSELGKPSSQ